MGPKELDILHHLEAMRRYAGVLTRSADSADDHVHSALVRAYERRSGFREGADLWVWLLAILHNLFIDQLRSRRGSEVREQAWADLNPGFAEPVGEQAARLSQLRAAFLTLPAEQREELHTWRRSRA